MSQGRTNRLSKLVDILEEALNAKCESLPTRGISIPTTVCPEP